ASQRPRTNASSTAKRWQSRAWIPFPSTTLRPSCRRATRRSPRATRSTFSLPPAALFPFNFLSPPRPNFLNSSFATLPRFRDEDREPEVELHPEDAAARGLRD